MFLYLAQTQVSEIGLKLQEPERIPGTIEACFQTSGKTPWSIDAWKSMSRLVRSQS